MAPIGAYLAHLTSAAPNRAIIEWTAGIDLCAIASAVAARKEVRHLVLLSPFESLEQLLRKRPLLNAMRWTLRQKFDCTEDARRVRARPVQPAALESGR